MAGLWVGLWVDRCVHGGGLGGFRGGGCGLGLFFFFFVVGCGGGGGGGGGCGCDCDCVWLCDGCM